MKHIYLPILTLVAAATALFSSCSSQTEERRLLDAIPADATSVVVVNLERATAAGISRPFLPVNSAKGSAAIVTLPDGHRFTIAEAPVTDSLAARGFAASGAAEGALASYTDPQGLSAVVDSKSGLVYYMAMSAPRAEERVGEIAASAAKSNFTSIMGLAEYFDQKSAEAVAYGAASRSAFGASTSSNGDPQAGEWLAFSASEESGVADIAMKLIYGSGKPVEIKGLQTISPDFLRYVPANMNVVAAAGLTPDIDWDAAASMVSIIADRTTAGYIAAASPYLKSINGTVAIAVGADNPSSATAADMRFFAMARMDRDKINDFIRQAGILASMAGAGVESVSESMARLTLPSGSGLPEAVYLGEVDGNLVIASYLPDGKAENPFASPMEGHDASAVVSFPAGALPAARFPSAHGLDVKFALDGSEAHARVSFPGSDRSPLAVIWEMAQ